jgi:hypothetical protein
VGKKIGWRFTKPFPETLCEIRGVAEADSHGDLSNIMLPIFQHSKRFTKPEFF